MDATVDEDNTGRRWGQFRLRSLLLLVLVCAMWFGWMHHQQRANPDERLHLVSIDVSSNNVTRAINIGGNSRVLADIAATSYDHDFVSEDCLAALLREVRKDRPYLTVACPMGENWVFYVAHNRRSRIQVKLQLDGGAQAVVIDGKSHGSPFDLAPGAHGFQVTSRGGPILVKHEFVPLDLPPNNAQPLGAASPHRLEIGVAAPGLVD